MPSFCCEQCDKVFSYQGALDMHTLTYRAKADAPSKTDTPSTKRAPGHQCMICDIVFPYGPGRLARHLSSITHRAHVREIGIYCSCGKDFLNPAGFPYHQCTPPSDKPPGHASWVQRLSDLRSYHPLTGRPDTAQEFPATYGSCQGARVHVCVRSILFGLGYNGATQVFRWGNARPSRLNW